jgi:undecaprenyl phosphate N,N'-diacetylbacillosamine 1-phosphate transferase
VNIQIALKKRFEVKPGITGLAQVKLRNSGTWNQRIKCDIAYVDSMSLINDFKICYSTFWSVIKKKNIVIDGENKSSLKKFS